MRLSLKSSLARNAGWMLLGQGLGYGLRIVYFIVIARLLGVLQYGIVVGAFALVNLAAQYSRLGMGTVLLRYVSGSHSRFATYWGNILIVTSLMSGILIVILRFVGYHVLDPETAQIVALTAVGSCLCEQITISATQAFQAFQKMRTSAVLNQLTSLLRTFAAVGMLLTYHHATARQWVIASMFASAIATIAAVTTVTVWLGWPTFKPYLALKHASEGAEYAFASSTESAYNDLDKTMLSHYGMDVSNGIYGMAYRVIEMSSAPLGSIILAASPRLFQLAESSLDGPIKLGRRLLRHCLFVSLVASFGIFLLAPLIPKLAGQGFADSVPALRWLSPIPIFRSLNWNAGSVLTSIGFQRYRTITQISAVALNFGLNIWLIPGYGWHGAAWASLLTDGALGVSNWCILKKLSGRLMGNLAPQGA